jgi:hypothetical protein
MCAIMIFAMSICLLRRNNCDRPPPNTLSHLVLALHAE